VLPPAGRLAKCDELEDYFNVRDADMFASADGVLNATGGSAGPPPASPACGALAADGACGPPFPVTLVPYGMTHLRMSVLPWTPT
jgi:hypothetical protein